MWDKTDVPVMSLNRIALAREKLPFVLHAAKVGSEPIYDIRAGCSECRCSGRTRPAQAYELLVFSDIIACLSPELAPACSEAAKNKSTLMIDATTIDDIKKKIFERKGGGYISLILFCRYRRDETSLPWRIAANNINYHYSSGKDLDIYVPGFSFYGRSEGDNFGTPVKLENAEPFGFYYPKVFTDAEDFLRKEMKGFHLGSSVVAVAIEVQDGVPDWKNGAVINLSQRSAEDAEAQIMTIIDGCKHSPGRTPASAAKFQRNFRLNGLVDYLSNCGWSAASTFAGVGALFLS